MFEVCRGLCTLCVIAPILRRGFCEGRSLVSGMLCMLSVCLRNCKGNRQCVMLKGACLLTTVFFDQERCSSWYFVFFFFLQSVTPRFDGLKAFPMLKQRPTSVALVASRHHHPLRISAVVSKLFWAPPPYPRFFVYWLIRGCSPRLAEFVLFLWSTIMECCCCNLSWGAMSNAHLKVLLFSSKGWWWWCKEQPWCLHHSWSIVVAPAPVFFCVWLFIMWGVLTCCRLMQIPWKLSQRSLLSSWPLMYLKYRQNQNLPTLELTRLTL